MNQWLKGITAVALLLLTTFTDVSANTSIEDINALPPGEQYRQLSLILLISGGADPALMEALAPRDAIDQGRATSNLSPDDYKTPLIRIVDQESMLTGAAFLLRFAQESGRGVV